MLRKRAAASALSAAPTPKRQLDAKAKPSQRSTPRKAAVDKVSGYLVAPAIGHRVLVLVGSKEHPATVVKVAAAEVEVRGESGDWAERIPHGQWFKRTTPIVEDIGGTQAAWRAGASPKHLVRPAAAPPAPSSAARRRVLQAEPTLPPPLPPQSSRPQLVIFMALAVGWSGRQLAWAPLGFEAATLALVGTSPVLLTEGLLAFRVAAFGLVAAVLAHSLLDKAFLHVDTRYLPRSALGGPRPIAIRHWQRLSTFTVWCWALVGVYFLGAACASFAALRQPSLLIDAALPAWTTLGFKVVPHQFSPRSLVGETRRARVLQNVTRSGLCLFRELGLCRRLFCCVGRAALSMHSARGVRAQPVRRWYGRAFK
jgi:hypothetical protein